MNIHLGEGDRDVILDELPVDDLPDITCYQVDIAAIRHPDIDLETGPHRLVAPVNDFIDRLHSSIIS
jgi:hypothetical protein